ncbi:MAG: chromosomal replication initiator protein DnaA [Oscillospiraceae bacterium]|jgi:chromosomal replication initiator protein|nr:chromosomal replication initiator protein DnaA [Oscillospiraceae bacterium]
MNSFAEIFEMMKKNLDITDVAKKSWIEPIKPVRLNNNKVVLYVPSPFVKQILEDHYVRVFKNNFKDILGFEVEIEIFCDDDIQPEQRVKLAEPIPELQDDEDMIEKLEKSVASGNYKHTFDTFIVGESNKLAYAACKAVAQGQNNYNPLYIYGDPGLGKTHLLSAVRNEIQNTRSDVNIVLATADSFVSDFINSIKFDRTVDFKNKFRSADVLLIDDIQFISGKKECQQELFNVFNELHGKNKQIIFTSDRTPKEINDIEQRLQSRFEWGLLADISIPEFETRLAIIKRKAELVGLNIPQNVTEYIANNLKNNIRQMEGAIIKMNAISTVTDIPPTLVMAQNVVKEVISENIPIPVTVERIINEVANIYNVTPDEIRSQKRSAQISTARQIAIFVINRITGISYTEIGKEFGGRDHSTIVYAINKVKNIIQKDKSYRATIDDIVKNIGNSQ